MDRFETSIEFLSFIADISDPGTGAILLNRLAERLGMSPVELEDQWSSSGQSEWAAFADEVLAVLDLLQDRTHSLTEAVRLYRLGRIPSHSNATIESLVVQGKALQVLRQLRHDPQLVQVQVAQK